MRVKCVALPLGQIEVWLPLASGLILGNIYTVCRTELYLGLLFYQLEELPEDELYEHLCFEPLSGGMTIEELLEQMAVKRKEEEILEVICHTF